MHRRRFFKVFTDELQNVASIFRIQTDIGSNAG